MQKLGKKLRDHLQKSAWILMTEFYGHKNLLTQRSIGQSCTLLSKAAAGVRKYWVATQIWVVRPSTLGREII